jgi:hypothetical protein
MTYEYMASFFLMLVRAAHLCHGCQYEIQAHALGRYNLLGQLPDRFIHTGKNRSLILTAISALFAWFIPGLILEKDYRKAKKELGASHV